MNEERFFVTYRLFAIQTEAEALAADICLEQTVELPDSQVTDPWIRQHIIGQIEGFTQIGEDIFEARISYAASSATYELTQFLNVIFGNTSLKPRIRIVDIELGKAFETLFPGPRFGISGLREQLQVSSEPLLCTALKPMGKSPKEIADIAYRFALGGIHIIKDDHGLADQPFCQFQQRVTACCQAVAQANQETGLHCIYAPNVTSDAGQIISRAYFAQEQGAGAMLIAPGLTGFATMLHLSRQPDCQLPLISHPAFLGSLVTSPVNGISHAVIFGKLQRLAGADASIYPNYGGRFGFSQQQCLEIVEGCKSAFSHLAPIFPTPGGGMPLERIAEMLALYGKDVIFLIGGSLYARSPDLTANAKFLRAAITK